jgi:ABC-type branched-subunit amino acid transport system substrate-binding protein
MGRQTWTAGMLAALLLALGLTLAACGEKEETTVAVTTSTTSTTTSPVGGKTSLDLVIGDSLPLSGKLSDFGQAGRKASDLAIDTIHDAIDETGAEHSAEIAHEDGGSGDDQSKALGASRKLVDQDAADCIAGPWTSDDVQAVADEVTLPAGVPLISPAASADSITEIDDGGLVMRTVRPDSAQGAGLAAYVSNALGGAKGKTVNIGARDDAYGNGIADSFTVAWKDLGGKVGKTEIYPVDLTDPDAAAKAIVAGKPDAVVIADFPKTFSTLAPALVRTGDYDPAQTFVSDGLVDEGLASQAGADAVEGLRGVGVGTPDDKPATQNFDKAFADADPMSVEPRTFAAQNFDAVILCYLGAVAAGSTDGTAIAAAIPEISAPGGDLYSWEQLPQAIKALQRGEDIDYQGASGSINLDAAGDATAGVYDVFRFEDGKPVAIDQVYSAPAN